MIDPAKLAEMMRQAQQLQERLQQELGARTVVGEAGGGLVKVAMNGLLEVKSVKIDRSAIDPNEAALLEDLVRAALSQAVAAAEALRMEQTRAMAGGLGIPGL